MTPHFSQEFKANLQSGDLVKLRATISNAKEMKLRRVIFELTRAPDRLAIPILATLCHRFSNEEKLTEVLVDRYKTMTDHIDEIVKSMTEVERLALARVLDHHQEEIPNHLEGQTQETPEAPQVLDLPLLPSPDELERMASSKTGDPTQDREIQDRIDEALLQMDAQQLTHMLDSGHVDIRVNTKTLLVNLDEEALPALHQLLKPETHKDKIIHGINVLGLIANEQSITPLRNFIFSGSGDANIRFAAYESLGMLPLGNQVHALIAGLEDNDDSVRLAVVTAVEKSSDPRVIAGLGKMIDQNDQKSIEIISLILNGECDHLFFAYLDKDFFKRLAYSMLNTRCHQSIVDFFNKKLVAKGMDPVKSEKQDETRPLVYAVDDSRMILMIYRKFLHKLGYRCKTFESPRQALAALDEGKPDLVFTDLNMIGANGIDLARDLRKQFTIEQLPIYMVTTQDESPDFSEAYDIGINKVLNKPFTSQILEAILEQHFGV